MGGLLWLQMIAGISLPAGAVILSLVAPLNMNAITGAFLTAAALIPVQTLLTGVILM
jgi:hypothetical protein